MSLLTGDPPVTTWRIESSGDEFDVLLEEGERWWGGAVADGQYMPFGARAHSRDLALSAGSIENAADGANQSAPLLLSSTGRLVWSEPPFAFTFGGGNLKVSGREVLLGRGGICLRDAFRVASERFFPPSGRTPASEMFTGPQYNTWIELPFLPTQEGVLTYARRTLDSGMLSGTLMIDDNWAQDYGTWQFDLARFPDPRRMVEQLHSWGFSLMLWLVPFVSPDSATFRLLERDGLLIRDAAGETVVRRWWNGLSALLDLTNPATIDWLTRELDALTAIGVDGLKFDGGDLRFYAFDDVTHRDGEPVDLCEAWARLGLRYSFNEYRACWKRGGQPLAQRLHDKPPSWGRGGCPRSFPSWLHRDSSDIRSHAPI